jgi:Mg2+ and Co2+ transporter CorA
MLRTKILYNGLLVSSDDFQRGFRMKMNWYLLKSEVLKKQPSFFKWAIIDQLQGSEIWIDIEDTDPNELRHFLSPLDLHPLQMEHCLDLDIDPGVMSFSKSLLIEYPAFLESKSDNPSYLTIILKDEVLITIRHGLIPSLDALILSLTTDHAPKVTHLPQLIYQILDQFADLNADAEIKVRDQIQKTAEDLAQNPNMVSANDLTLLRSDVGKLISLMENQLYCVSRLVAADIESLQEPHRKAYLQDLLSEAEIAQRGAYRLETRVNDLYRDYQMVGNDRVEKRLRLLTIVSAITLPLGLVAGLLGMNVGGLPGTNLPTAFIIVIALMVVIALAQYWFFKSKGWFD